MWSGHVHCKWAISAPLYKLKSIGYSEKSLHNPESDINVSKQNVTVISPIG